MVIKLRPYQVCRYASKCNVQYNLGGSCQGVNPNRAECFTCYIDFSKLSGFGRFDSDYKCPLDMTGNCQIILD